MAAPGPESLVSKQLQVEARFAAADFLQVVHVFNVAHPEPGIKDPTQEPGALERMQLVIYKFLVEKRQVSSF